VRHVCRLALHQLELANGLVELRALHHVWHSVVHAGLHQPYGPRGQHQALIVQPTHQYCHAVVESSHDLALVHHAVLEHELAGVAAPHAQLVQLLRSAEPRHTLLDQETRHSLRVVSVGLGVHTQHVGVY
jgi:hypothetical protein